MIWGVTVGCILFFILLCASWTLKSFHDGVEVWTPCVPLFIFRKTDFCIEIRPPDTLCINTFMFTCCSTPAFCPHISIWLTISCFWLRMCLVCIGDVSLMFSFFFCNIYIHLQSVKHDRKCNDQIYTMNLAFVFVIQASSLTSSAMCK